jgi:hypothetical protein
MAAMTETDGPLPLPTLLSHALVAFTIEFDNEFEHRMSHRTTVQGRADADAGPGPGPRPAVGPWLVSMAMWSNCMRLLDDSGMRVRELEELALAKSNLEGMRRWGYIRLGPDPSDTRSKPPAADLLVQPTRAGRAAQEVWRPLTGEIEQRWQARFGRGNVEGLRKALVAVVGQARRPLPHYLPVLGYGLWTGPGVPGLRSDIGEPAADVSGLDLAALLSGALLGFALGYERGSEVSMAIGANLLRVLDAGGVRVRDLPQLTGVAKPGIEMALGVLQKRDLAGVRSDPSGGRWKVARLTQAGVYAREAHSDRIGEVEELARNRFGAEPFGALRRALEPLVGDPTGQRSPLYGGLVPYPDGWRAQVREPDTLPHFPVVLHRGGYPDGS